MREIALAAQTVLDVGPVGLVHAAAMAGCPFVGPRIKPVLASDPRVIGTPLEDELVAALRTTGVQVMESGVFPITAEMNWSAIASGLRFSARIGARFLGCPCDDPDHVRAAENLAHVCELAQPHGLVVLVEFSPRRACGNLEQAFKIVSTAGKANSGLLIDALHLSRSGGQPSDLASVDPHFLRLAHLCDATPFDPDVRSFDRMRAEANQARLYPGEGHLWLEEFVRALPHNTPLSIEAPSAKHAHRPAAERAKLAIEATRKLLHRCGEVVGCVT